MEDSYIREIPLLRTLGLPKWLYAKRLYEIQNKDEKGNIKEGLMWIGDHNSGKEDDIRRKRTEFYMEYKEGNFYQITQYIEDEIIIVKQKDIFLYN